MTSAKHMMGEAPLPVQANRSLSTPPLRRVLIASPNRSGAPRLETAEPAPMAEDWNIGRLKGWEGEGQSGQTGLTGLPVFGVP